MSPHASASGQWHRYLRFWRPDVASDVDDEIAFHVDARTQELISEGRSPDESRAAALREFGDVERARATLRAMDERHESKARIAELFTDVAHDVRVAVRSLSRSPGLVAIIAITLALGIGLNSAVYSIVDAYLFRPMDVANGKELVVLAQTEPGFTQPDEMSYLNYLDFRTDTAVFRGLAAYWINSRNLSGGRGADRVWIEDGTANYFDVLGVKPFLGRLFQPGDDNGELAHPYIVLSYKFWQAHFGGDPRIIGDTIRLNNHPITIIGVTPPEFHGANALLDIDGFAPINQTWPTATATLANRAGGAFNVFGLLRRGVTVSEARHAVNARAHALEELYPQADRGVGAIVVRETNARPNISVASNVPAAAAAFMTLVLLVLAIACANVASLLLARSTSQFREHAIRAALGASQWRMVRRVLIECVLLAAVGGLGAVALATVAVRALTAIRVAADVPIRWTVVVDHRVMGFTLFVVLITAAVASLAPVIAMRRANVTDVLKSGAQGSDGGGHRRLRNALVVTQLAVSVVIVVSAALFARSTGNATHINLGFRTENILMASATLGTQGYDSIRGKQLERDVQRRVAELPGVRSVALSRRTPLGYDNDIEYITPEIATTKVPENGIGCFNNTVSPEYFETMRIPIVEGRGFTPRDDEHSPRVVVVTRKLASTLWPGQSAIGKRFRIGKDSAQLTIVGVAGDIQYFAIGETPKPFFFRPYAQDYRSTFTLDIHTVGSAAAMTKPLRAAIASLDPELPVFDVRTLDDHILNGRALLGVRIGAWFAGVFGALALALASVGIYGLLSYSVAQRTREIGIRMALGARTVEVVRLMLGQGLRISVVGIAIGMALTWFVTRLLSQLLFGVTPHDPVILALVALLLTIVALFASFIPARRATRVDPSMALRAE